MVGFHCPGWMQNCYFYIITLNNWTHIDRYSPKTAVDPCSSLSGTNAQSCAAYFTQMTPLWRPVQWRADSVLLLWSRNRHFKVVSKFLHRTYCEGVRLLASTSLMTRIRARHNPPHHNSNCLQWLMFAKWHEEVCPNIVEVLVIHIFIHKRVLSTLLWNVSFLGWA